MTYFITLLKTLRSDEEGATAIEYGLIAALIAVAIVGGAGLIGGNLEGIFEFVGGELDVEGPDTDSSPD